MSKGKTVQVVSIPKVLLDPRAAAGALASRPVDLGDGRRGYGQTPTAADALKIVASPGAGGKPELQASAKTSKAK